MAKLAFYNARLITPEELVLDAALLVQDTRILGMVSANSVPDEYAPIDLEGCWLSPGFVDIHVHGAGGVDTLDAEYKAIQSLVAKHLYHGTTALYPTVVSASPRQTMAALLAVQDAMKQEPLCGKVLGAHLEGPFLNPAFCGAHEIIHLRNPADCVDEWQKYLQEPVVKLITLAPELTGSEELSRAATAKGIRLAVGHSGADYDQLQEARTWGVNQCSHIFNAMLGIHHRDPGTAGTILAMDAYYAQIIADGVHLHPALLHIIARCKGAERGILVSDAIRTAGMPEGEYTLGGRTVVLKGGEARTVEGSLAGSNIFLADAVRNLAKLTSVGLQTAVQMATLTPAKAMGIENSKGSLNKGRDADLVVIGDDLRIRQVWSRGKQIR
ncbi:MAG: N-acetylglucosamine-6-phosphate deacetylase [Symbiobacteriaceae bacterium]|nr:N-acetylglucosamine-6-phosphate deacetylase [Symbiobacteriaceae bacterium]